MAHSENLVKTALKLAENGKGLVSPNPLVGAVVAKGGRILGEGFHRAYGMAHAEIEALEKAGQKAKGASLYVNLEPCCHYGKTPPCTKAIIEAGIKEVICPMKDPNPRVNGRGFEELEKNGIKVRLGFMEREAMDLNRTYLVNIEKKRPYVILKWAQTLDGKTATFTGDSMWITGQESREYVKKLRFETDAISVGIRTVLNDNPHLDYAFPSSLPAQMASRKKYRKVILDPELKIPFEGNLWNDPRSEVIIMTSDRAPAEKISAFRKKERCEIIILKTHERFFSAVEILECLYERNVGILFVEGGSVTLTRFWEEKAADETIIFFGNRILGSSRAIPSIGGADKEKMAGSAEVKIKETKMFGQDIMIRGIPCFQE